MSRNKARPPRLREGRPTAKPPEPRGSGIWLFGKHPVMAALRNPNRKIHKLMVSKKSTKNYNDELSEINETVRELEPEIVPPVMLEKLLPSDCVHQGIALATSPLTPPPLEDCAKISEGQTNLVLVLDQVTDPHNVGAIMRTAAAFGAKAVVTTDRHAPPESGTLAKSASGTLEIIPWVRVSNLARALDNLAKIGYWRIGLDSHTDMTIDEADFGKNIVIVLGAEGAGLRKGTRDHCDAIVKLPMKHAVESLNVSNAAAIALYKFSKE